MTHSASEFDRLSLRMAAPFFLAAILWAVVGLGLLHFLSALTPEAAIWMLVVWALSMVDLLALAKTVWALIKTPIHTIQAFYWGSVKLACLGLFIGILLIGKTIPSGALLAGLGTLVVVPLLGGAFWEMYRHA